jgi:nucleoside 2-deoxyribosyltransferase
MDMTIYLAAPLFGMADRLFNRQLAAAIEARLPDCRVILPQDSRVGARSSFNDRRHSRALFDQCLQHARQADLVLAVLDGADADSGVAYEVGYAAALGKRVIGIRTDFRQLQVKGLNVMLAEGCADVVCHFSFSESVNDLADALLPHIEKARPA